MIPFNYHHLYYFYVIAQAGTIAEASAKLLLNQSTLSLQLKQFEKSIRRPLFERRHQRLFLTPTGNTVLKHARQIFELGNELNKLLKGKNDDRRKILEVGVMTGTPPSFGHALLRCLRRFDPRAQIVLKEGSLARLLRDLREFRLDTVISDVPLRSQEQEEFENFLVGRIPIVLAAAPVVARRIRNIPADLEGAPFILPSSPSQVYHLILERIAAWKIRPHVIAEIQDIELVRRMALAGEGIAPINAYTVSMSQPRGGLKTIGNKLLTGLFESIYLVTRRQSDKRDMINFVHKNLLPSY